MPRPSSTCVPSALPPSQTGPGQQAQMTELWPGPPALLRGADLPTSIPLPQWSFQNAPSMLLPTSAQHAWHRRPSLASPRRCVPPTAWALPTTFHPRPPVPHPPCTPFPLRAQPQWPLAGRPSLSPRPLGPPLWSSLAPKPAFATEYSTSCGRSLRLCLPTKRGQLEPHRAWGGKPLPGTGPPRPPC